MRNHRTINLKGLDRRDSHLIVFSLCVTLLFGLGLAISFIPSLSSKAPPASMLGELFLFFLVLVTYVTMKHRENRRLRSQIIDEKIQVGSLQARVNEISALLTVTSKVSSIGSLDTTLRLILNQAVKLLGTDQGFLLLKGSPDRTLRTSAIRTLDASASKDGSAKAELSAEWLDKPPAGLRIIRDIVLKENKSLLLSKGDSLRRAIRRDSDPIDRDILDCPSAILASPLRAFGKTFGVVAVTFQQSASKNPFSRNDRKLLRILANNASCAMRNLALYEKVRAKNEKLRQSMEFQKRAQRKLLEAEKLSAIRELVSGVAHELNNPLTSILGYVQLLERTSLEATPAKYAKIIFGETERCRSIVQDFLAFARKEKPDRTIVELNEVIQQLISLRRRALLDAGIEIESDLSAKLPKLIGDPHCLQEALLNTLKTLEAVVGPDPDDQRRLLRISTRSADGIVFVLIKASGPNMEEERLESIFDPFFITGDGSKGSGLSLCLAREILIDHGGDIEIDSSEPGVLCTVRLPVDRSETGTLPYPLVASRSGEKTSGPRPFSTGEVASPLERRRALVAVDRSTLPAIEEVLRQEEIEMEIIEDPKHSSTVQIRSYDLVILDAEGIGPYLREELAPLAAWCPHVILHRSKDLVTIHDFPSDDNHFHLPKPVEKGDLRQVVRRAIQVSVTH